MSAIDGTTLLILAGLLIAVWLVWTEPKEDPMTNDEGNDHE